MTPGWWNGIHEGLKILCRKACEFESRPGYHNGNKLGIVMPKETITYQGKIIEVVEYSPDGARTFEKARRAPGTRTIVIHEHKILLTREYRHELDSYDYRLPGGKVFDTLAQYNEFLNTNPTHEQTLAAARAGAIREIKEEAGIELIVDQLSHFYTSICGATVQWDLYYFVANITNKQIGTQALEDGEDITLAWYDFAKARELALDPAKMSEDRSVAVLLRWLEQRRG